MLFTTFAPPATSAAFVKIEVRSASDCAEPASVTLPLCVVTFTRRPSEEIDLSAAIFFRIFSDIVRSAGVGVAFAGFSAGTPDALFYESGR